MATLTHAESRRLYSWWWNSHISPKNSKWLQENLSDMDMKVKSMIKLIEEDADSFARRAEMYYKKRPELMKLVEEFYRAYRALAERYDHATGALRQAHRTIEETFPNQIPFALSDQSPGSFVTEEASHSRKMSPPIHTLFDYDDSDDLNMSSQYQSIKTNGRYYDKNNALTNKKGLGQFNQMPGSEEETIHVKSPDGSARKGSNFLDEERNNSEFNMQEASRLTKDNEDLKSQIISESVRADTAEAEVQGLKEAISQLNSEKEAALSQINLSLENISKLEIEISQSKDNFQKLNHEMQMVTGKLNFAEEQNLFLENSNQVLQLELGAINQRSNKLQEDINRHQEEIKILKSSLQDEHLRFLQAEKACLSFEKLLEQSQEEISFLNLESQTGTEKLKDIEMIRTGLEKELQQLKEENGSLNEKHLASSLEITSLQDEMSFLKDSKAKLEHDVMFHIEEKEGLEKELFCLQEERNELEQNCHRLAEQVETLNLNVESFEGLVKELQNGNEELQDICKERENEKVTHLENLKCLENISEKNMALENYLSDATDEIEGLREKIKALEEFCESLCSKVNLYLSENTALASQVETVSQDMEQLTEKNTFLERSLCDANAELESLRGKLKVMEEYCQSLCAQTSNLLSEKSTRVHQIEEIIQNLGNLKARYAELDLKYLNLENEKDLALRQAMEFEYSLKQEREEHETLILSMVQSSKSQLSILANQIILLQEEGQLREEDLEAELHKIMDSQIEIFILQRCLCDMNERNLIFSVECQNLVEALKYAEKIISELKQEVLTQEEKLTSSAQRSKKLREGIQLMLTEICLVKHCGSLDGTEDDPLLHLALHEIKVLLKHFSDTRDENQHLLLEKSFIVTILKQFALGMVDVTVDKNAVERECRIKTEKLLLVQSEELELLTENKQLKVDMKACNQRQEEHKAEIGVLLAQLRDLEEASGTLKSEISNLCEENQSLEKKLYELTEKKEILEEENDVIFAEALTLENLHVISRGSNTDKMLELQLIRNDMGCLQGVADGFAENILMLTEKFIAIEIENMCLKDTVVSSGECQKLFVIIEDDLKATRNVCKQLYLEVESGKSLLAQKDVELSQALENKSGELCKNIECLHMDTGALVLRGELENKISNSSEDNAQTNDVIACIHQENDRLNRELCRLHKQVEDHRSREEHLSFELQKGVDEVNYCENEIAKLLNDVQITTLDAAIFEEKLLELLITCESFEISAMVQRERLHKEITLRTAIVNELKEKIETVGREKRGLKEEVDAYLLLVPALSYDITSLEEHITTLAKHHRSHFLKRRDNQLMSPQHNKNSREQIEVHGETMPAGIVELQKLHAKVKVLQKVVIDTRCLPEQEMLESNPTLHAAMKDIEVLKSKGNSGQEEAKISKDINQLENRHEPSTGHKPHKGDEEISVAKSEQMMKDIQLDHVLSSSRRGNDFSSYRFSVSENTGTNDQDLDMWGTTEIDCSNRIQNASSSVRWRDMLHQQIEIVEEEKKGYPSSELVAQKELGIDKLEPPMRTTNSRQEWNRRVIEGLSSDAQRLQVLQTSVQELKRNIETSEKNCPTDFEFDTVKSQLKEAEGSISHLINVNSRLAKKASDFSANSDIMVGDQNEIIKSRRKISDRGRRVSEKIGRLELELNKVKYVLLKIKEEHEAKRVKVSDRRKVLLKDYLYGRTESRKQKKVHCRCMRPKTRDD